MRKIDIETTLRRTLKIHRTDTTLLNNRESTHLEFKRTFNLGSSSKYARTMAGFSNNSGGFIVFGVENAPKKIVGVDEDRFNDVDPARLTSVLNEYFSPEMLWDMGQIQFHGVTLGYIYTHEAFDKPIIATKSKTKEIQESAVYYRYRAQSTYIKYAELNKIIEERLDRDRKSWIHHLETIGRVGPTNVGIIDTIEGKLFAGGTSLMLSETLARQLRFIREGAFVETGGDPTLRLIGDIRSLSGATTEVPIPVGIHYEDIVRTFLSQMDISAEEAMSYLQECAFQSSAYTPIYHYIKMAGITLQEAERLITETETSFRSVKHKLIRRIREQERITPLGPIDQFDVDIPKAGDELISLVNAQRNASGKRSAIHKGLRAYPNLIRTISSELPPLRLFEAITHLDNETLSENLGGVLGIMQDFFHSRFKTYPSGSKTVFRKALCFLDQQISTI
jgi:hypothetical protein